MRKIILAAAVAGAALSLSACSKTPVDAATSADSVETTVDTAVSADSAASVDATSAASSN